MLISKATLADAAPIAQVHAAAWRSTYTGIVAQEHIDRISVEDFAARWQNRLADTSDSAPKVLVASDEHGAISGFVSGGRTRDATLDYDAELYAIYLLQAVQRQGIGRRLVHELGIRLYRQGHTSMCVRVLRDNPARLFYERLGAVWIRDEPHVLGGISYQSSWYGWRDIQALIRGTVGANAER